MSMSKQYVIKTIDGNYLRIFEDSQEVEVTSDISAATFYDSEDFAYEDMMKNTKEFESFVSEYQGGYRASFFKIECVVVILSD